MTGSGHSHNYEEHAEPMKDVTRVSFIEEVSLQELSSHHIFRKSLHGGRDLVVRKFLQQITFDYTIARDRLRTFT